MDIRLVMFKADGTRRDFPIKSDRVVVGRTNHCDLRIPLSSVSRQHCEFQLDNGKLRMRDLGSSNGTFHNNNRVQEASLEPGDEIVIGPVVFTVIVNGEPGNIEPVRTIVSRAGHETDAHLNTLADDIGAQISEDLDDDDEYTELLSPVMDNSGSAIPMMDSDDEQTVDMEDPIAAFEALAGDDDDDDDR